MMKNSTQITCPKCHHHFDVEEVLTNDLEKQIGEKFRKEYAEKLDNLKAEKESFEAKKKQENELFAERLEKERKSLEKNLATKLKKQLEDEQKDSFEALQKELNDKSEKLKDFNKLQSQISKLEREKSELKSEIEADAEKKLNEQIALEKERIRKQIEESQELKFATLNKQLDDQKKLTEEMKRNQFRFDEVEEVLKGTNGADVLQTVKNERLQNCGKIIYETKRTKNFDQKWIDKLKQDQLNAKADIAVLVTETLPKNVEKFDAINGIWICSYQEVKSLVVVLRQILIETQKVKIANENRGDKMEILYQYFTSGEFSQKTKRILEIYDGMLQQLEQEKKVTQKLWAKREKDIQTMKENLSIVSGDIAGITGKEVHLLEEFESLNLE
jgi:hypothetical protein